MARSFTEALSRLATAQKASRGVSLYSRFINRPVGRALAAACYVIGLSPNQVTILSAITTGGGIAVVALVEPAALSGLCAAVLLMLGFALDSADGQVARLTGRGSLAGEWLDHVVDAAKIVALHAAVIAFMVGQYGIGGWAVVPVAFQVVAILIFFGGELQRLLLLGHGAARASALPASTVRSIALLPADYGVLAVSFVLLGWPQLFTFAYTGLLVANAVILGLLATKWFRALSQSM